MSNWFESISWTAIQVRLFRQPVGKFVVWAGFRPGLGGRIPGGPGYQPEEWAAQPSQIIKESANVVPPGAPPLSRRL